MCIDNFKFAVAFYITQVETIPTRFRAHQLYPVVHSLTKNAAGYGGWLTHDARTFEVICELCTVPQRSVGPSGILSKLTNHGHTSSIFGDLRILPVGPQDILEILLTTWKQYASQIRKIFDVCLSFDPMAYGEEVRKWWESLRVPNFHDLYGRTVRVKVDLKDRLLPGGIELYVPLSQADEGFHDVGGRTDYLNFILELIRATRQGDHQVLT